MSPRLASPMMYQCDGKSRRCRGYGRGSFRTRESAIEHARAHGWEVIIIHGSAFFFCPECRKISNEEQLSQAYLTAMKGKST